MYLCFINRYNEIGDTMFPFKKKKHEECRINPDDKRYCFHFYGKVQGVGFRFVCCQYAIQYHLTGWVCNEEDGSVTLQIQGDPEKIRQLIQQLYKDTYIKINSYDFNEIPVVNESKFIAKY